MAPLLAVTVTAAEPDWHALPWGWIALFAIGVALLYVVRCLIFPFANCRWCKGSSRRNSKRGKIFGRCWMRKGTGHHLRLGRRVINKLAGISRDAS